MIFLYLLLDIHFSFCVLGGGVRRVHFLGLPSCKHHLPIHYLQIPANEGYVCEHQNFEAPIQVSLLLLSFWGLVTPALS